MKQDELLSEKEVSDLVKAALRRVSASAELTIRPTLPKYDIPRSLNAGKLADDRLCLVVSATTTTRIQVDQKTTLASKQGSTSKGTQPIAAECLDAFIRLHDAADDPARIVHFAKRFGVLGVCEHYGEWEWGELPTEGICAACRPKHSRPQRWREPVEVWVAYAKQLRATLELTRRVKEGEGTDLDDWRALRLTFLLGDKRPRDIRARRLRLRVAAERWIDGGFERGAIRVGVGWLFSQVDNEDHMRLMMTPSNLIGLLAVGLVSYLESSLGLYRCDSCGIPYAPVRDPSDTDHQVRQPKRGMEHHCPACRADGYRIAQRKRARDRYWRTKAAEGR
jgi:hypothetical protein